MTQQFHPMYVPKQTENLCPYKNVYTNAHSSIIHNNQKVETTQMSIKWWVDKQMCYIHIME